MLKFIQYLIFVTSFSNAVALWMTYYQRESLSDVIRLRRMIFLTLTLILTIILSALYIHLKKGN